MTQQNRASLFDPIRILLTSLVIVHHAAITYGGSGDWYYVESGAPEGLKIILSILTATNQSFFMGFFFLLAGYFTPGSLARKGETAYLGERLWRIGFPILLFGHFLNPLTKALSQAAQGADFLPMLGDRFAHNEFDLGPLWFNQALIFFAVAWCFVPRFRLIFLSRLWPTHFHVQVLLLILVTAMLSFALRLVIPTGSNVIGMQLGYFASYVVLFVAGASVARTQLLQNMSWRQAGPWLVVSLLVFPTLWIYALLGNAFHGNGWRGGWNLPALAYASWEPFVAAGIILSLLALFRNWRAGPASLSGRLADASFVAFVIHAPILVATSGLVRDLALTHLTRFLLAAPLACILTFALADRLTRFLAFWKTQRCEARRH